MKKILLIAAALASANFGYTQQVHQLTAEMLIDFPALDLKAHRMHPIGDKLLIYAAVGYSTSNYELWSYDLNSGSAVKIDDNVYTYEILDNHPFMKGYPSLNGKFYTAPTMRNGNNLPEIEPYVTDGTAAGSYVLADIYPNTTSSFPAIFTKFDNHIIFRATSGLPDQNLFKHDGINPPTPIVGQHSINEAVEANNQLIFSGRANNISGICKLASANSNPESVAPFINTLSLTPLGNKVIFYGEKSGSAVGYELYITDGTAAGTTLLKDLVPGSGSPVKPFAYNTTNGNPSLFAVLNDVAYFSFKDPNSYISYLYRTDGTTAGTYQLMENATLLRSVLRAGNQITFMAWNDTLGKLHSYATSGGIPTPLTNGGNGFYAIEPGVYHGELSINPINGMTASLGNYLLNDTTFSYKIIISDGTTSGTKAIDISSATGPMQEGHIRDFNFIGDQLYFCYGDAVYRLNLSSLVSAEGETEAPNTISIYPNPAKNTVSISAQQLVHADVFTVTGQLAASYKNAQTLDIEALPSGVYVLRLTDAEGNLLKTERLIKAE